MITNYETIFSSCPKTVLIKDTILQKQTQKIGNKRNFKVNRSGGRTPCKALLMIPSLFGHL